MGSCFFLAVDVYVYTRTQAYTHRDTQTASVQPVNVSLVNVSLKMPVGLTRR